jgi:hypothetical protein
MKWDRRGDQEPPKVGGPTAGAEVVVGKTTLHESLSASEAGPSSGEPAPARQMRTDDLPVQRKASGGGIPWASKAEPHSLHTIASLFGGPGAAAAATAAAGVPPVEHKATEDSGLAAQDGRALPEIANRGVEGGGTSLPHLAPIQDSFRPHDVSGVRAHQGPAASAAARELGAEAYAFGDSVAFGSPPDLHTAAHEAAHVVQQRGGVQLKGGIDQPGDAYERHADAVADAVVAGRSAAPILDQMSGGGPRGAAVQRTPAPSKSGGTSHGPRIAAPKAGIDKTGFIDNSTGAPIYSGPAEAGGEVVRDAPLPPGSRVFVSGTHHRLSH